MISISNGDRPEGWMEQNSKDVGGSKEDEDEVFPEDTLEDIEKRARGLRRAAFIIPIDPGATACTTGTTKKTKNIYVYHLNIFFK